jgi:(1->4)-alpha-D-glucan 1-alpha-D-glucosylmutase
VEDDHVFSDTHRLVLEWLRQGVIDGLRIDHPDGLRYPESYLRRLAGEAPPGTYVVVEKILEPGEELPSSWPVAGTTGYDFCNLVTGLFLDPAGEDSLTRAYAAFTKEPAEWTEVVWEKKHLVMREVLSSEVERLTALAVRVCEGHRRYRDYTRHDLHEVITALIAAFPVYRIYVVPGTPPSPADSEHLEKALEVVKARRPDLDVELFDFVGELLLGRHRGLAEDELVARFQQLTGPVMAKGVEDTAFYTYNRLVALNEVGGNPGRFGTSLEELHRVNTDTASSWPETLLATATHDTKRSEDVRARIALLSEVPDDFAEAVARWSSLNKAHRSPTLRDRNMEWLLYQTLVGAWPLPLERARAYAEKAAKEAKVHTSWVDANPAYDRALRIFVERLYGNEEFQADLGTFSASLVTPGRVNSLAQTALRLTCPGVPDTYQGTELWDLSLVDPDNRRPIDWELRRRLLDEVEGTSPAEAWARPDEGLPKLLLVQRLLLLRRRRPEPFAGSYEPLWAEGERAAHLMAFARGGEVVTAVPRLVMGMGGDWADATLALPPGHWADALDGGARTFEGVVAVTELLAPFPVAVLERA